MTRAADAFPLYELLPALRAIPRVSLCVLPSSVALATIGNTDIWIKCDGTNAPVCGGNKARALEFLLAGVKPNDTIITSGGEGSTHVLTTAVHARRLGARVIGIRWRHEMNHAAYRVAEMIGDECVMSPVYANATIGLLRAQLMRISSDARYIPAGGSTPLGILAHVNAALELVEQIRAGNLPAPARVVVPLGSGGTAAGLALGFAMAQTDIVTVAVQVTPGIVANGFRLRRLISRTAKLIGQVAGVPRVAPRLLAIAHDAYGGAYGRVLPAARDAARALEDANGLRLDDTYSAKAFLVALTLARSDPQRTLFWSTFDSRLL